MSATAMATTLTGAGSSLVAPLEVTWATDFTAATGGADNVQYAAVGSGTGVSYLAKGLVDFGASDAPLQSGQACPNCLTIPWALSGTGLAYDVPGVGNGLKLTPSVIAGIYLGTINNWRASAITKLNKGLKLPNLAITAIHRSDSSGDTFAFTNYLTHVSSAWRNGPNLGLTISWPGTFPAAKGNSGLVAAVKATPGAIAYIAGPYLVANQGSRFGIAKVQNAAGSYEYPLPNQFAAAAKSAGAIGSNGASIVDPPKAYKTAYPISTFTYAIVPTNPPQNAGLLKQWLRWCVTKGRGKGAAFDFAQIPSSVQKAALNLINQIS